MSAIWNTDYSKELSNIPQYPPQAFPINKTALVQVYDLLGNNTKANFFYYRRRSCDTNLTSNTPAAQYQRQKLIQNTVRVDSSQYTMNRGALASYQQAIKRSGYVPWNQMSDRALPSRQKANANGGNTIGSSSTRHSVTRLRPGSTSPGGIGCDIKHNSYERRLNRLKGKAPLRRGVIPPNFGVLEIPFNRANPTYGGKIMKTSIVTGCNCPIDVTKTGEKNQQLYKSISSFDSDIPYVFSVGQKIFALINGKNKEAIIQQDLGQGNFSIQLLNGTNLIMNQSNFLIYYNCASHVGYVNSKGVIEEGNFVDKYISNPGAVIGCQKLNGSISNIKNTTSLFPALRDALAINGVPNSSTLLADNGVRYTNGVRTVISL
jgi:hypothetical protein